MLVAWPIEFPGEIAPGEEIVVRYNGASAIRSLTPITPLTGLTVVQLVVDTRIVEPASGMALSELQHPGLSFDALRALASWELGIVNASDAPQRLHVIFYLEVP